MPAPEMTPQEAESIIRQHYEPLIQRDLRDYLATGELEFGDEPTLPPELQLIDSEKVSVRYIRVTRSFEVNGVMKKKFFSKGEATFFEFAFKHPNVPTSFPDINRLLWPNDKSEGQSGETFGIRYRPMISRMRGLLNKVKPGLGKILKSVRGSGIAYVPHESLNAKENETDEMAHQWPKSYR